MEDALLATMLTSNIDDIKNQCLSNRSALQYCNQPHFWKEKFKHDNLPLLSLPKNINDWIKEYKLMQQYKYDAQDILMINKIESERTIDKLNIIIVAINDPTYHLAQQLFNLDIYDEDYTYNIVINNKISHYEMIFNSLDEDNEIKKPTNYNEILNLLISVMYLDPHPEILDQNSDYFNLPEQFISLRLPDEQRIAYKRLGIRETLKYL